MARHDQVILQYGGAILEKVGKKNANYVPKDAPAGWASPNTA